MPITLKKLPDQPIMIGIYDGVVRCQEVEDATEDAIKVFEADDVFVNEWRYYIIDTRTLEMDFNELVCIIDYELKGLPGTFSDPCTFGVIVGTNVIVRAFQKIMHQKGIDAAALSVYLSMEDAYAAIQDHMDTH